MTQENSLYKKQHYLFYNLLQLLLNINLKSQLFKSSSRLLESYNAFGYLQRGSAKLRCIFLSPQLFICDFLLIA